MSLGARFCRLIVALTIHLVAFSLQATTIIVPTDDQLIAKSPLILIGTVQSSESVERSGIWTETILRVERTLRGNAASTVTIREVGGRIGNRMNVVFGSPEYRRGERVLVFLWPTRRGDYQTRDLAFGKFTERITEGGRLVWHRQEELPGTSLLDGSFRKVSADQSAYRLASPFERYITSKTDETTSRDYLTNETLRTPPQIAPMFTLIGEGSIYRWFAFDNGGKVSWKSYGTQPGYTGGGLIELAAAFSAWNSYPESRIGYQYDGAGSGTPGGLRPENGINEIVFNDLADDIDGTWDGSSGVVGRGGFNNVRKAPDWTALFTADARHPAGVYPAQMILESNLVIQDGLSQVRGVSTGILSEILAHEVGHTLGFNHSQDQGALMFSQIGGNGASLRSDDKLAARWLYPRSINGAPPPSSVPPDAPTDVQLSVVNGDDLLVRWTDNSKNENHFNVYIAAGGRTFFKAAELPPDQNVFTFVSAAAGGTYDVRVGASNDAGEVLSTIKQFTMPYDAVRTAFTASPEKGTAGVTRFSFTDQTSGGIAARLWNFGDGATSTIANPAHTFTKSGVFTVTLKVTLTDGRELGSSSSVRVFPPLNAAFVSAPALVHAGVPVTFSGADEAAERWLWNFGDGTSSSERDPVHIFSSAGTFRVSLTVYDEIGSATVTRSLQVKEALRFSAIVPVAADVSGPGGTPWRTEITLFNGDSRLLVLQARLLTSTPQQTSDRTGRFVIAPGQTLHFENVIRELFGTSNAAGAIVLEGEPETATAPLSITTRIHTTGASGSYGQLVPTVTTPSAGRFYLPGLQNTDISRSNAGLVNRSSQTAEATLTLFRRDGSIEGMRVIELAGSSFQQFPLTSLFPALAKRPDLTMQIDTSPSAAVTGYASVIDTRSNDPVFIAPLSDRSEQSLLLPLIGRSEGAEGTFWRSDVTLFNPVKRPVRCILSLPDGVERTIQLTPGQTLRIEDVLSTFARERGLSTLKLRTDDTLPLITSTTYTRRTDGGSFGMTINALSDNAMKRSHQITGVRSESAYRSNAGFLSSGGGELRLTLVRPDGSALESALIIPAGGPHQYPLRVLFPSLEKEQLTGPGTLKAEGAFVFFAYVSVIDQGSGDPLFIYDDQ